MHDSCLLSLHSPSLGVGFWILQSVPQTLVMFIGFTRYLFRVMRYCCVRLLASRACSPVPSTSVLLDCRICTGRCLREKVDKLIIFISITFFFIYMNYHESTVSADLLLAYPILLLFGYEINLVPRLHSLISDQSAKSLSWQFTTFVFLGRLHHIHIVRGVGEAVCVRMEPYLSQRAVVPVRTHFHSYGDDVKERIKSGFIAPLPATPVA